MREAPVYLVQAAVFLLLALGFAVLGLDLARFPGLRPLALLAVGLIGLTGLAVRRRQPRIAALCGVLTAGVGACGVLLVFYELLFVGIPASVGMEGLLLAYVVSGLLGGAANAALTAVRALQHDFPARAAPRVHGEEPARSRRSLSETVQSR